MFEKRDQLVIVIGRNYSNGLAVVRSLGAAGYTVDFIASAYREKALNVVKKSKYIRQFKEVISQKVKSGENDPALLDAIMEYAGKTENKPILFTTDDYTTTIVDINRQALEPYFLMPSIVGGHAGDLSGLMDKTVQVGMAKEMGLLVPYTTLVSLRDEQIEIPDDVVYPCYVKPRKSIEGFKTEMAICDSEKELAGHLERMKSSFSDREVIVQEYLQVEHEYASAGTCNDQEIILPALISKKSIGKHGRGVTLTGELVPLEDSIGKDISEKAINLLKSFHYIGNFGLEFIVAGGKIYFNEVNLRSAGESYSYYKSGVNLPDIFAESILGLRKENNEVSFNGFGKTLIYDKIAWEDYIYGYITKEQLDEYIDSADFKVLYDEEDPGPSEAFIKKSLSARKRRDKRVNDCAEAVMAATGCERSQAEKEIEDARERTGITYDDYLKYRFWEVPAEQQIDRYVELQRLSVSSFETVVLSRDNTTGLGVIRSLNGFCEAILYAGNASKKRLTNTTASSKYISEAIAIRSKLDINGVDAVIKDELMLLAEDSKEKRLLIPADSYAAVVVDSNREALSEKYYTPYVIGGKPGDLVNLMRKSLQMGIAEEVGLDVPSMWCLRADDPIEIPEDIEYPCVCKPDNSTGTYKVHIKKCDNEEELLFAIRTIKTKYEHEVDIIIQEYVEADAELSVSGVSNGHEIAVPAVVRYTKMSEHNKGYPLTGQTESAEIIKDCQESIEQLIRRLGYVGAFEVELFQTGERLIFSEVNFGFSKAVYALFKSGINVPANAARAITGLPLDKKAKLSKKSFAADQTLWIDYARKSMSKRDMKSLVSSADVQLLSDPDDPEPYNHYVDRIHKIAKKRRQRSTDAQLRKNIRPYLGRLARRVQGYPQGKKGNLRDPNSPDPRIMVVGRNWCSNLCMAKSLSQGGYEVEILHVRQKRLRATNIQRWLRPEKFSRHVKAYYICNSMRNSVRIVDRLKELADKDRKMLLIPLDDLVGFAVDEYYDDLKELYILPSVNDTGGELTDMMSKAKQKDLARKAGLPVVNSCIVDSSGGEVNIPDSVNYPCFIKPNVSKSSFKTRMMKCESREELHEVLTDRLGVGFNMLVEDFIDIKRELSYLGLSTPDGVVCPGYFEAVIEGVGSHRGVALLGRTLPAGEAEPLISQVAEFVKSLNYTGLFDVDLVEDQNGKIYFVELNLRYGGSGFAFTKSGLNLPVMYADYMLHGKPIDMDCNVKEANKLFVNEKVLMDEYIESIIDYDTIKDAMRRADINFVKDEDDMRPYRHWRSNLPRARRLRKILAEQKLRKEERIKEMEALEAEKERQALEAADQE